MIKQKQAAYVTWRYEIEAADEDEALTKFYDGDHDFAISHEIGDNVDGFDSEEEVEE